jgi:large subunit ribosomal protein L30
MSRLEIHQHKSAIGEKQAAKGTLQALGLRRTGQRVSHEDTPALRGMLRRVAHLVDVAEGKTGR